MPRVDDNLTTMIAQIDHAAGVVKRMREFLRRGEPHISTINVRALIDDALMLVGAEAADAADPDRRRRLRRSAAGACGPRAIAAGHPQSGAEFDRCDRQPPAAATGASGSRPCCSTTRARIEIAVSDNGAGIAPALAERLFEPLTTSKQDGLGLAFRSARQSCSRITAGSGYNPARPAQPNSVSGSLSNRPPLS